VRGRGAKKGTEGVAGGAVLGREGRKGAEVVWGTATRTDTDKHGQARTASGGDGFTWNLEPCGEVRMQRSEVRGNRTAGTAEQPFNAKGANETQTTQAIFWGRGAQAGAKGRSAALSTPAQGRWMGREGGGRNSHTDKYGRTRTDTDRKRGTKDFFVCGGCVGGFWGFS
jgi:hypothetical protein